jgi:Fe-S-cluster containining protein
MDLTARDAIKFVKLHGTETPVGTRFEAKCSMLNGLGRCAIYQDRPNVCRQHFVGCGNCLECIDRYHSADMAKIIKESFNEELTSE